MGSAAGAARGRDAIRGQPKPADSPLDQTDIEQIALEHLLVGSAIDGVPIGHSGGGLTANPDSNSGVTGPGSTDSYVFSGGDTRTPVTLLLDAPHRRSAAECQDDYGRRPVVAVLDTGVRAHPWLDVERTSGSYNLDPAGNGDGFMSVDLGIQKAILDEGKKAEAKGDKPRQLIRHPWDTPITADPLVGELDSDSGHCTFISGIVRQIAPDARVLAVRIMHSDGAVYEGDLLCALRHLVIRIAHAQAGHPEQMVDVLSLSLGYFDETPHDEKFTSGLWDVIELLLGQGVIVVAAAGNYSTSRRFYPAAFATKTPPAGVPLISVGALNPNGSKAIFSDGGHWITAWASGAAVVSTLPVDINASRSPALRLRAHPDNPMPPGISLPASRESLDPDDYSRGWAVWSGTSFSAPLLAAQITRALMEGARRQRPQADALRAPGHTEPGAVRAEEHELAGLTAMDEPQPVTVRADKPDRAARMADLLSAARTGSDDALGQIVNELSPLLWQVARSAGLSQGDAEDVLQTVWMRLITHLDSIHDAGALTGWLVTTTKREAWRVRAAGPQAAARGSGRVRRPARQGARL